MAEKYQTMFKLTPADMDVMEQALRERVKALSMTVIAKDSPANSAECPGEKNAQMQEIHDLLGRLHNQKVWYRPEKYVPRG